MQRLWTWYLARHRLIQIWTISIPLVGVFTIVHQVTGFGLSWPWYVSVPGGFAVGWVRAQVGRYVSDVARATKDTEAMRVAIERLERGDR